MLQVKKARRMELLPQEKRLMHLDNNSRIQRGLIYSSSSRPHRFEDLQQKVTEYLVNRFCSHLLAPILLRELYVIFNSNELYHLKINFTIPKNTTKLELPQEVQPRKKGKI